MSEKVHSVVARSTFRSQNAQNTRRSDHFWTLRCRKKCTPLWREAHLEVKSVKNWRVSEHFWKLRCRKSARPCGAKNISKSKVLKTEGLGDILDVQMSLRFASPHYIALHYTTLHYTTLHYTYHSTTLQLQLHNYTPLHSTTLHYTKLHYTPLY